MDDLGFDYSEIPFKQPNKPDHIAIWRQRNEEIKNAMVFEKTRSLKHDLVIDEDRDDVLKLITGTSKDIKSFDTDDELSEYAKEAMSEILVPENSEAYFCNSKLVDVIGIHSVVKVRLGRDAISGCWKIYLKKCYGSGNSTTLGILYSDTDDILAFLKTTMDKIKVGIKNKKPLFYPEDIMNFRLEKPNNILFWRKEGDDNFFSSSGTFRVRIQWSFGNRYIIHFNCIQESDNNDFYVGPRIHLVFEEVVQLIETIEHIKSKFTSTKAN